MNKAVNSKNPQRILGNAVGQVLTVEELEMINGAGDGEIQCEVLTVYSNDTPSKCD